MRQESHGVHLIQSSPGRPDVHILWTFLVPVNINNLDHLHLTMLSRKHYVLQLKI